MDSPKIPRPVSALHSAIADRRWRKAAAAFGTPFLLPLPFFSLTQHPVAYSKPPQIPRGSLGAECSPNRRVRPYDPSRGKRRVAKAGILWMFRWPARRRPAPVNVRVRRGNAGHAFCDVVARFSVMAYLRCAGGKGGLFVYTFFFPGRKLVCCGGTGTHLVMPVHLSYCMDGQKVHGLSSTAGKGSLVRVWSATQHGYATCSHCQRSTSLPPDGVQRAADRVAGYMLASCMVTQNFGFSLVRNSNNFDH